MGEPGGLPSMGLHRVRHNWSDLAAAAVTQFCPTHYEPRYCSPPGSSVHGISQARILEWAAIPFSRRSSWPRDWTQVSRIAGRFFTVWATREAHSVQFSSVQPLSHVRLFATPWTIALQAPPSIGFLRREYWSGLPFPSQGDLPIPGIEPIHW